MRGRRTADGAVDRWQRADWWGVVLDCPDALSLARFYSDLLGWPIWRPESADEHGAALDLGEGVGYLSFQRDPGYEAPVWPPEVGRPRMMMHLDFEVSDLDAAVDHALELGASLPEHQPQDGVRVLLDPVGHPFCLYS
ncbi:VOC family protein [Nocardioides sp.]|uniref:VOC family protein n=1 Tax=Nocardioides sp. TaxID=35761 RepID=UPI002B27A38F|nr:VOC family protein [Nocardioides sp.]